MCRCVFVTRVRTTLQRARCRARKEGDLAVRARAGRGRERRARDEANGVRSRAIARGRAGFGVEARGM